MKRTVLFLLAVSVLVMAFPPCGADPPVGDDPSDGGLVKVRFGFLDKDADASKDIDVMFNPDKVSVKKQTPWREPEYKLIPMTYWTKAKPLMLKMDLFFDTSEEEEDVSNSTSDKYMNT